MFNVVALSTAFTAVPLPLASWRPSVQANPLRLVEGADPERGWIDLHLENGQRVRCRPLPSERRWRPHNPPATGTAPACGEVEVRLKDGSTVRQASGLLTWDDRPAPGRRILAWRFAK